MNDRHFLEKAIEAGNKIPEPYNFGAVVVIDNKIVVASHGKVQEQNDPSLHAEVSAISEACRKLESQHIDGAILYCSHEPCVMCFCCAVWAHVERIVYATPANEQDPAMYEFKSSDLGKLSKELLRPIKVEHLRLT